MRTHLGSIALLFLVGCGKDKDWSKEALKPATCNFKGKTLEVTIPDGLEPKMFEGQCSWNKDISAESFVGILILEGSSKNASDAKKWLAGKPKVEKAEDATGGGYLLTYHYDDKKLIHAEVGRTFGELGLKCDASAANVPNADATIGWLATICESMKVK